MRKEVEAVFRRYLRARRTVTIYASKMLSGSSFAVAMRSLSR